MADENYRRKLTAILSADVAGYSRFMREDEDTTFRNLKAYRKLVSKNITAFKGRVVNSPGDNVLAKPGQVAISGMAFNSIRSKKEQQRVHSGCHMGAHALFDRMIIAL